MGTTTDNYQRKKKLSKSQMKRTQRLEKSSHRRYGTRKKEGLNKICAKLKFKWQLENARIFLVATFFLDFLDFWPPK
nr:MAG: hypothetical protein [Bacteriophage sp.]